MDMTDLGGRLLRLRQIVRMRDHRPGDPPPIIPVSEATWTNGVRSGRYPPRVALGANTAAWRGDYIALLVRRPGADWERELIPLVMSDATERYSAVRELLAIDYGDDRLAELVAAARDAEAA